MPPITRVLAFSAFAFSIAACAALPTITFDEQTVPDGAVREDAAAAERDAFAQPPSSIDGASSGDSNETQPTGDASSSDGAPLHDGGADSASDGARRYKCGTGSVDSCDECPSGHMLCTDGRSECLSDCTACNASTAPCVYCADDAGWSGLCVLPQTNGGVACPAGPRCSCDAIAECPSFTGSSQTCVPAPGGACKTCGESGTLNALCQKPGKNDATCASGPGASGKIGCR